MEAYVPKDAEPGISNTARCVWLRTAAERLKNTLRIGDDEVKLARERKTRLGYAAELMGVERSDTDAEAKTNKRVLERAVELQSAVKRQVPNDEDIFIVDACVEYANEFLRGREWEVLTLSLDRPTPGLRLSPDLMRDFIISDTLGGPILRYKTKVAEFEPIFAYDFKARVISEFINGIPKWGPEHVVPLIESVIDWKSGNVKRWFVFDMFRYNIDTMIGNTVEPLERFVVNPNPEYEPFGAGIKMTRGERRKIDSLHSRTHWRRWWGDPSFFEKTEDGRIKVTAPEDSKDIVWGHAPYFVPKNADKAIAYVEKHSQEIAEIEDTLYRLLFENGMKQAKENWENGYNYEIPVRYAMLKTDPRGDPFLKPLR